MMRNIIKICATLAIMTLLFGCVADQRDRRLVKQLEKKPAPYDSGSIFKAGFNERPLYEERRARNVGDGLIMNVPEAQVAAKKGAAKENANNEDEASVRAKKRKAMDEDITNIASDALVGNISMTVIDVMENGNLFVAGGKKVTVYDEDKYVRITGMVDPATITGGNVVQSKLVSDVIIQVDDLRIYSDGTASNMSEGQSTFSNFFQGMRP